MALEKNIQQDIINYLKAKGAYCFKRQSDAWSGAGGSDVTACYEGLFVALEIKQPDGTITGIQRVHLRRVQKAKGIGEAVRSLKRVQEIIECIDAGGTWNNTVY